MGKYIDKGVAQRVGEMLADPDPSNLQRGIRMVANNRTLQNALGVFDQMLARVGGEQAGTRGPPLAQQLPAMLQQQ
jgi:hypothetical protein